MIIGPGKTCVMIQILSLRKCQCRGGAAAACVIAVCIRAANRASVEAHL